VFDSRLAEPTAGNQPPSLEAYREYLEGRDRFYRSPAPMYRSQMRQALTFFQRAVALDSTFLEPRFFVVLSHLNLGEGQAADSNAQLLITHRPRMSDAQGHLLDYLLAGLSGDRIAALEATRAYGGLDAGVEALRANRPREAIDILASVDIAEFYYKWLDLMQAYHAVGDHRRELREAEHGRSVFPDRMRVLNAEVHALAALGRVDEVMQRLDESVLLPAEDGMVPGFVMKNAAAELRVHGHREAAFEALDRALEWLGSRPAEEAASGYHRFEVAEALYMKERWEDARAIFEELAQGPPHINVQGFLGVLAARRGDRETALAIGEGLTGLQARRDFGRDLYWQACIASLLGDRERAMALLSEAYARGRLFSVGLHRDMDLEPLHDYPPFQDFLRGDG
jgi:tetratricopeptide (TPR) repeat protein